jgi:uncharacterized membrane protein
MGNSPGGSLTSEAFLWNSGTTATLTLPLGSTSAEATAINGNSEACGTFWFPNPAGGSSLSHPILWQTLNQFVDLGLVSGSVRGFALGLNDAGIVVGACSNYPISSTVQGFIWRNGVMRTLNSLLAPDSTQYQIWSGNGINNAGQIAATVKPTGSVRAGVLTPVPPHPGDTNCDWVTNIDDLVTVITQWSTNPTPMPFSGSADVNGDGVVDINDLVMVIVNWGG